MNIWDMQQMFTCILVYILSITMYIQDNASSPGTKTAC